MEKISFVFNLYLITIFLNFYSINLKFLFSLLTLMSSIGIFFDKSNLLLTILLISKDFWLWNCLLLIKFLSSLSFTTLIFTCSFFCFSFLLSILVLSSLLFLLISLFNWMSLISSFSGILSLFFNFFSLYKVLKLLIVVSFIKFILYLPQFWFLQFSI